MTSDVGKFMVVVPLKVKTSGEMQLFVTIAGCAVVMLAGFAIVPLRIRLDIAQRRARTTTWQLRHLIPAQIRFMGDVYSSTMMKTSELESGDSDGVARVGVGSQAGVSGAYPSKSVATRRDPLEES